MQAAWPLPAAARAAFEQQCIAKLRAVPPEQRGEGLVYRVIRSPQQDYLRSTTSLIALSFSKGNNNHYDWPEALRDKGK